MCNKTMHPIVTILWNGAIKWLIQFILWRKHANIDDNNAYLNWRNMNFLFVFDAYIRPLLHRCYTIDIDFRCMHTQHWIIRNLYRIMTKYRSPPEYTANSWNERASEIVILNRKRSNDGPATFIKPVNQARICVY